LLPGSPIFVIKLFTDTHLADLRDGSPYEIINRYHIELLPRIR